GGLWEGVPVEEVATPQAFARDPARVWRFYAWRQERVAAAAPNAAHRALASMEERFEAFLLVTQNVDDLHERAGSRQIVKLHGNLMEIRCVRCGELRPTREPISSAEIAADRLPRCNCGALRRPNVVWFGEMLCREDLTRVADFLRFGL